MKNIDELLKLSYDEIVEYFLKKYGKVPKNYLTKSGNKTSGITRGNEGLYIHHIDEDKMILLSNKKEEHPLVAGGHLTEEQIKIIYEDYQKSDRLVYCDILEHLLLHLKIVEFPKPLIENPKIDVGIGGVINFLVPEINDIYSGITYKAKWKNEVIKNIINKKEDYFKLLEFGINELKISIEEFYTSFNWKFGIWNPENNFKLFDELNLWLENRNDRR